MDSKTAIGERFKAFRVKLKLTGEAMGEILKMSRAGISAIENGKNYPSIDTVLELRRLYGLDVNWLMNGDDEGQGNKPLLLDKSGSTNTNTNTLSVGHTPNSPSEQPAAYQESHYKEVIQDLKERLKKEEQRYEVLQQQFNTLFKEYLELKKS